MNWLISHLLLRRRDVTHKPRSIRCSLLSACAFLQAFSHATPRRGTLMPEEGAAPSSGTSNPWQGRDVRERAAFGSWPERGGGLRPCAHFSELAVR